MHRVGTVTIEADEAFQQGEAEAEAICPAKEFVAANGGAGWTCGARSPTT